MIAAIELVAGQRCSFSSAGALLTRRLQVDAIRRKCPWSVYFARIERLTGVVEAATNSSFRHQKSVTARPRTRDERQETQPAKGRMETANRCTCCPVLLVERWPKSTRGRKGERSKGNRNPGENFRIGGIGQGCDLRPAV